MQNIIIICTRYIDFHLPLEIEDSSQWKDVNVLDKGCYETSWNSRQDDDVFDLRKEHLSNKFVIKLKERKEDKITHLEYNYCFYHCESTPWCDSFQIVVNKKKESTKTNVICRLNLYGSNKMKKVDKEKYLASVVGFMYCGE